MGKIYSAILKGFLGNIYKTLSKNILICVILFFSLYTSGQRIIISDTILYFMTFVFTGGIVFQVLGADTNIKNLKGLLMMPFIKQYFNIGYIGAIITYVFFTKTAILLSIVFAVCSFDLGTIINNIVLFVYSCLIVSVIFALYNKNKYFCCIMLIGETLLLYFLTLFEVELLVMGCIGIISLFTVLFFIDPYSFYCNKTEKKYRKYASKESIYRYFVKYIYFHKNYIGNFIAMWAVSIVLPYILKEFKGMNMLPFGFALVTLNTPLCILISCVPEMERHVKLLPKQTVKFWVNYCAFVFICNIIPCLFYCISWNVQCEEIKFIYYPIAIMFSLLSATFSVYLEYKLPIRKWKVESDLWHHPRKYLVPVLMIILAGVISILFE